MDTQYVILTFVGEFPLENQPCWGNLYDTQTEAIKDAIEQQEQMLQCNPKCFTLVMESNAETECEFLVDANGEHFYGDAATLKSEKLLAEQE